MNIKIKKARRLEGTITVPGDKSISHRALMISAVAEGVTEIEGLANSADVRRTIACLEALGVKVQEYGSRVLVEGRGLRGLQRPKGLLDAGNSGTTIRLLSGILAGQHFKATISGDESLRRRPMRRIIDPLRKMGAEICGQKDDFAPLSISGKKLKACYHQLSVPSAQVKSCLLFAGLYADGATTVEEPAKSRDHSERMLRYFGAQVTEEDLRVSVEGFPRLEGCSIKIPGDLSSAAFFFIAASLVKDSQLRLRNVGINPTRTGILEGLERMGCRVSVQEEQTVNNEPIADLTVTSASLRGVRIDGPLVPRMIDELPVLAVAATQAEGRTIIRGAQELRVKESDRIHAVVENLQRMGAQVEELPDGMIIEGKQCLKGAVIDSYGDHRIAMTFAIAGLVAEGETIIKNAEWVEVSFPSFFSSLEEIIEA